MSHLDFRTWNDYPADCYNIEPGCAVVFIPEDADDYYEPEGLMYFEKLSYNINFRFRINIKVARTDDPRLINRIVARRIDLGSLDEYSVITADISHFENLRAFFAEYYDITNCSRDRVKFVEFDHSLNGNDYRGRIRRMPEDDLFIGGIQDEDTQFIWDLERKREDILNAVARKISEYVQRFHSLPSSSDIEQIIKGQIQFGNSSLSNIIVDRELRVLLPGFDNVVLPFSALQKTLYILFLCHPEGIVLADMPSYRDELQDIYELVIPNREDDLAQITLDRLTDPMDNESLRQQLSKIKRIVKAKITNDSIAEHYYISGQRGYPYSIHIDSNMITLPRTLYR